MSDNIKHNQRRKLKRWREAVSESLVCSDCGNKKAYFLTSDNVKEMSPRQIRGLKAMCPNCLTERGQLWT